MPATIYIVITICTAVIFATVCPILAQDDIQGYRFEGEGICIDSRGYLYLYISLNGNDGTIADPDFSENLQDKPEGNFQPNPKEYLQEWSGDTPEDCASSCSDKYSRQTYFVGIHYTFERGYDDVYFDDDVATWGPFCQCLFSNGKLPYQSSRNHGDAGSPEKTEFYQYDDDNGASWFGSGRIAGVRHVTGELCYSFLEVILPTAAPTMSAHPTSSDSPTWNWDLWIDDAVSPEPPWDDDYWNYHHTSLPTSIPSPSRTSVPTYSPTFLAIQSPTNKPISVPTYNPTSLPTTSPTMLTASPTIQTNSPSSNPYIIEGFDFIGYGICADARGDIYIYNVIHNVPQIGSQKGNGKSEEFCANSCTHSYETNDYFVGFTLWHHGNHRTIACLCMFSDGKLPNEDDDDDDDDFFTHQYGQGKIAGVFELDFTVCYSYNEALPPTSSPTLIVSPSTENQRLESQTSNLKYTRKQ